MDFAGSFQRLRQLAGNPVLTCVKPRSQWVSVPSGYTFSTAYESYVNGDGDEWQPASTADLSANDYVTVALLPGAGDAEIALMAGGLVDQGSRFGRVLPADAATVSAAQWLELDGFTYDLANSTPYPAGAAMWYSIMLRKR